MTYTYKLTEEIARWAFEIKCKKSKDWYIAFTNPTAGPWKYIKCLNQNNIEGEIYRFGAKEDRPDIILVNDSLQSIIIIEAKDSLHKLLEGEQANKSVKVVNNLSCILKNCNSPFWGEKRRKYSVYLGLLWGCENFDLQKNIDNVISTYYKLIKNYKNIDNSKIINIITHKHNEQLTCYLLVKNYGGKDLSLYEKYMCDSLNINRLKQI